mmetsp:Transcript_111613/g.240622  ORF Transcript_111613/g.240622 Transcript_111613/m.240622 type:complete len:342 (-) Transcript_111613:19-1044(-)
MCQRASDGLSDPHLESVAAQRGKANITRLRATMRCRTLAELSLRRHLEHEDQSACVSGGELNVEGTLKPRSVVAAQRGGAGHLDVTLDAEHVGLTARAQRQGRAVRARTELRDEDVAVLVDLHRRRDALVVDVRDEVCPLVLPRLLCGAVPYHRAIIRVEAPPTGDDPGLDEAQMLLLIPVVLRVAHTAASRHELDAAASKRLGGAHGVLVRQGPVDNEGDDLHVPMPVRPEASHGLDEVVVHDAEAAEVRRAARPLGKAEVEPGFEPVLVGPALSTLRRVLVVPEHGRVWLADIQLLAGHHADGGHRACLEASGLRGRGGGRPEQTAADGRWKQRHVSRP